MAKEISRTEAQRRIVEIAESSFEDCDTDREGQVVIYTGIYYWRDGTLRDEPEQKSGDNQLDHIKSLISDAERIFKSEASWEVKYDKIFSMQIAEEIQEAGYAFKYYDPDTTYQEDITAYMQALTGWRDRQ